MSDDNDGPEGSQSQTATTGNAPPQQAPETIAMSKKQTSTLSIPAPHDLATCTTASTNPSIAAQTSEQPQNQTVMNQAGQDDMLASLGSLPQLIPLPPQTASTSATDIILELSKNDRLAATDASRPKTMNNKKPNANTATKPDKLTSAFQHSTPNPPSKSKSKSSASHAAQPSPKRTRMSAASLTSSSPSSISSSDLMAPTPSAAKAGLGNRSYGNSRANVDGQNPGEVAGMPVDRTQHASTDLRSHASAAQSQRAHRLDISSDKNQLEQDAILSDMTAQSPSIVDADDMGVFANVTWGTASGPSSAAAQESSSSDGESSASSSHDRNDSTYRSRSKFYRERQWLNAFGTANVSDTRSGNDRQASAQLKRPHLAAPKPSKAAKTVQTTQPKRLRLPMFAPHAFREEHVTAAVASRLPPDRLAPHEIAHLAPLIKEPNPRIDVNNYLCTRNWILSLWVADPRDRLEPQRIIKRAAGTSRQLPIKMSYNVLTLAYLLLDRYRYINFGIMCIPYQPLRNADVSRRLRHPRIVVVGAGIAGITAAREIYNIYAGYPDLPAPQIIILEARRRLGGRIFSYPLHSSRGESSSTTTTCVDLGAHLIRGFAGGNPLEVIKRQSFVQTHNLVNSDECFLYDVDGTEIDSETDARAERFYNEILDLAYRTVMKDGQAVTVEPSEVEGMKSRQYLEPPSDLPSLGELMNHQIVNHPLYARLLPEHIRIIQWHLANLEHGNETVIQNSTAYHLQLDYLREFVGPHAAAPGGLQQIPERMLKGKRPKEDAIAISYQKVVKSITTPPAGARKPKGTDSFGNGMCTVKCDDGSTYHCDAVIMTAPLGVLKAEKIQFNPPLPDWKKSCIGRLGMGITNKVILVFRERFWNADTDFFGSLVDPALDKNINSDPKNSSKEQLEDIRSKLTLDQYAATRGRYFLFWNMYPFTKLPVLTAFVSGQAAIDMESQSNTVIVRDVMAALTSVFKNKSPLPAPIETLITRWSQDEFSLGSVSYMGKDATVFDIDRLAAPCHGKLFWAGEATNREYPGTIHGALISGMRVASEIADALLGTINVETVKMPLGNSSKTEIQRPSGSPCHHDECSHHVSLHSSFFDHIAHKHSHSLLHNQPQYLWRHILDSIVTKNPSVSKALKQGSAGSDTARPSNKRVRAQESQAAQGQVENHSQGAKRSKTSNAIIGLADEDPVDQNSLENQVANVIQQEVIPKQGSNTAATSSEVQILHEDFNDYYNGDASMSAQDTMPPSASAADQALLPSEHLQTVTATSSNASQQLPDASLHVTGDEDSMVQITMDNSIVSNNLNLTSMSSFDDISAIAAWNGTDVTFSADAAPHQFGSGSFSTLNPQAQLPSQQQIMQAPADPPQNHPVQPNVSSSSEMDSRILIKCDEDSADQDFEVIADSYDMFTDERREAAQAFVHSRFGTNETVDGVLRRWWNELGRSARGSYSAKAKQKFANIESARANAPVNTPSIAAPQGQINHQNITGTSAVPAVAVQKECGFPTAAIQTGSVPRMNPTAAQSTVNNHTAPAAEPISRSSHPFPRQPMQPQTMPSQAQIVQGGPTAPINLDQPSPSIRNNLQLAPPSAMHNQAPVQPIQSTPGYAVFRNITMTHLIQRGQIPKGSTLMPPQLEKQCQTFYANLPQDQRNMYDQHGKSSSDAYLRLIQVYKETVRSIDESVNASDADTSQMNVSVSSNEQRQAFPSVPQQQQPVPQPQIPQQQNQMQSNMFTPNNSFDTSMSYASMSMLGNNMPNPMMMPGSSNINDIASFMWQPNNMYMMNQMQNHLQQQQQLQMMMQQANLMQQMAGDGMNMLGNSMSAPFAAMNGKAQFQPPVTSRFPDLAQSMPASYPSMSTPMAASTPYSQTALTTTAPASSLTSGLLTTMSTNASTPSASTFNPALAMASQQSQQPQYNQQARSAPLMIQQPTHSAPFWPNNFGSNVSPSFTNQTQTSVPPSFPTSENISTRIPTATPIIVPPEHRIDMPPPPGYAYALVKLPTGADKEKNQHNASGADAQMQSARQSAMTVSASPAMAFSAASPTGSHASHAGYGPSKQHQQMHQNGINTSTMSH